MFKILVFMAAIFSFACRSESQRPTLTVCELIQSPQIWEGKIVRVKGFAPLGPTLSIGPLIPDPPGKCTYQDSKYTSSREPAEIDIRFPDTYFLARPPDGFKPSIGGWKFDVFKDLRRQNPAVQGVSLTVDGFVSLRKYRIDTIPRNGAIPVHLIRPIIVTIESYAIETTSSR